MQKLYDRLVKEALERKVTLKMELTLPAMPDGYWHLDIGDGEVLRVVDWRDVVDRLGFGISVAGDHNLFTNAPDAMAADEDAVIAWLWP